MHYSDRGSLYLSNKYTERLDTTKTASSAGGAGDSYDNALAKTINGLFKAELIHRRGLWRSFEAVEYATHEWVDWFTIAVCWNLSGISRPLRQKQTSMLLWKDQTSLRN